eukprot:11011121-Ditylum_brightwellii.AAC.1
MGEREKRDIMETTDNDKMSEDEINPPKRKTPHITQETTIDLTGDNKEGRDKETEQKEEPNNKRKETAENEQENKEVANKKDEGNLTEWELESTKEVESILIILSETSLNEALRKIGGWHLLLTMLTNEITMKEMDLNVITMEEGVASEEEEEEAQGLEDEIDKLKHMAQQVKANIRIGYEFYDKMGHYKNKSEQFFNNKTK